MSDSPRLKYSLEELFKKDVTTLVKKDASYASSWKKRGGCGAYMMAARKWDRIEAICQNPPQYPPNAVQHGVYPIIGPYDIFKIWEMHDAIGAGEEHIREQVADLRRYLALIESEMNIRKSADNYVINGPATGDISSKPSFYDTSPVKVPDEVIAKPTGNESVDGQTGIRTKTYQCSRCGHKWAQDTSVGFTRCPGCSVPLASPEEATDRKIVNVGDNRVGVTSDPDYSTPSTPPNTEAVAMVKYHGAKFHKHGEEASK